MQAEQTATIIRKYFSCIDISATNDFLNYILKSSSTHLDYKSVEISNKQRKAKLFHSNFHQPSFSRFLAFL